VGITKMKFDLSVIKTHWRMDSTRTSPPKLDKVAAKLS